MAATCSSWRMPTVAEWTALRDGSNFNWEAKTETDEEGNTKLLGYTVTSKVEGYDGNSIFLPAAGGWSGTHYGLACNIV